MSAALATGPTLDVILAAAAVGCGVRASELLVSRKRPEVVEARAVGVHLARQLTALSLVAIGERVGMDRASVIEADRRIALRRVGSRTFERHVRSIMDAARIGEVPPDALAAIRAALGAAAGQTAQRMQPRTGQRPGVAAPAPAAPTNVIRMRPPGSPAPEATALRITAEAAAGAWRACRQAEFTPHEKPARERFEAAMKALEDALKRRP